MIAVPKLAVPTTEWAMRNHPGVWSARELGWDHPPHIREWYELEMRYDRLAVCAPREYAKSETFSVNTTAHHVIYRPGSWQVVFSNSMPQAKELLERVVSVVAQTNPELLERPPRMSSVDVVFWNWSRVTVASTGRNTRGWHPDRIVGDDVLNERNTATAYQRAKVNKWWFGSVAGMAHPGVHRPMRWGKLRPQGQPATRVSHPPTTIVLVGTPFHQSDLLMSMRSNRMYRFFRYAAEFDPLDLVPGMRAIEAA